MELVAVLLLIYFARMCVKPPPCASAAVLSFCFVVISVMLYPCVLCACVVVIVLCMVRRFAFYDMGSICFSELVEEMTRGRALIPRKQIAVSVTSVCTVRQAAQYGNLTSSLASPDIFSFTTAVSLKQLHLSLWQRSTAKPCVEKLQLADGGC